MFYEYIIRYSLHVKSLTGSCLDNHHDNNSVDSCFGNGTCEY